MKLITEKSKDYELLDSGGLEKLERFGKFILRRPELQALWPKLLEEPEWQKADATYIRTGQTGKWVTKENFREMWQIELEGLTFNLKLLPSKHLGVFPEQSAHWKWLKDKIKTRHELRMGTNDTNREVRVLNLFGYTGGASLALASMGAKVVHIDASKFVILAAHKNYLDSGLKDKQVRFIVDDARKFVEKEIKRGNKYDIILLDPPVYGKSENKLWHIEKDLVPLLSRLKNLVSENFIATILNGYSSGYSATTYAQVLYTIVSNLGGQLESGQLVIKESSGRLLPAGIFARWSKI